ncbi:hypothetical protein [Streptomyces sp. LN785]|uniref:hypothetical protein n=1 Tax=Streptomyces sp. LN785 TaxID=3112983 RepID=UPI00370FEBB6
MTATPAPRHAHHQDINNAILLTPTRCHPTTQSQRSRKPAPQHAERAGHRGGGQGQDDAGLDQLDRQ